MIDNKWQHGPVYFEGLELGPVLSHHDGLLPFRVVLDPGVGTEVILVLHDQTDFMNKLKSIMPFRLFLKTGLARNEFGPLGFLLFWIQDPANPSDYVVAYDVYLNPTEQVQLKLWRDLASQTHWHLFLVGAAGKQEELFEFENGFGLNEFVADVDERCRGIEMVDFYLARDEFANKHSVRDIFNM